MNLLDCIKHVFVYLNLLLLSPLIHASHPVRAEDDSTCNLGLIPSGPAEMIKYFYTDEIRYSFLEPQGSTRKWKVVAFKGNRMAYLKKFVDSGSQYPFARFLRNFDKYLKDKKNISFFTGIPQITREDYTNFIENEYDRLNVPVAQRIRLGIFITKYKEQPLNDGSGRYTLVPTGYEAVPWIDNPNPEMGRQFSAGTDFLDGLHVGIMTWSLEPFFVASPYTTNLNYIHDLAHLAGFIYIEDYRQLVRDMMVQRKRLAPQSSGYGVDFVATELYFARNPNKSPQDLQRLFQSTNQLLGLDFELTFDSNQIPTASSWQQYEKALISSLKNYDLLTNSKVQKLKDHLLKLTAQYDDFILPLGGVTGDIISALSGYIPLGEFRGGREKKHPEILSFDPIYFLNNQIMHLLAVTEEHPDGWESIISSFLYRYYRTLFYSHFDNYNHRDFRKKMKDASYYSTKKY